MSDKGEPEERVLRHVDLYEAIDSDLRHAVDMMGVLRDRISGTDEKAAPEEVAPQVVTPAPVDVYSNAPGEIRDQASRISALTDEIRGMVV